MDDSLLTMEEMELTVFFDTGHADLPVVQLSPPARGSIVDLVSFNQRPLAHMLLSRCVKICRHVETPSRKRIEFIWVVMDLVYKRREALLAAKELPKYMSMLPSEVLENFFLMGCQMCVTEDLTSKGKCSQLCYLLHFIIKNTEKEKKSDLIHLAASSCTQEQRGWMVSHIEGQGEEDIIRMTSFADMNINHKGEAWQEVVSVFRQKCSMTLREGGFLSVVRAVGGNPRKTQPLNQLPNPILNHFQVPFKDLHEQQ